MTESTRAQQNAIVRERFATLNNRDYEAHDELYVPDSSTGEFTDWDGEVREHDSAGEKQTRIVMHGVPGPTLHAPRDGCGGEWVLVRYQTARTHDGPFLGLQPTGRSFDIGGHASFRFEDGRIADVTRTTDYFGALIQLGVFELPLDG